MNLGSVGNEASINSPTFGIPSTNCKRLAIIKNKGWKRKGEIVKKKKKVIEGKIKDLHVKKSGGGFRGM